MNNQENNSNINNQVPIVNIDNMVIKPVVNVNSTNNSPIVVDSASNIDNFSKPTMPVTPEVNNSNVAVVEINQEINQPNNVGNNLVNSSVNILPTMSTNSAEQTTGQTPVVDTITSTLETTTQVNEIKTDEVPLEKDFIDEELEKQKNKNNIKGNSVLFIVLIFAVVSGVIYQLCFRYKNDEIFKETNNNSTSTSSDDVANKDVTILEEDRTGIFVFSGTYTNQNNDSVVEICAINENKAKVSVTYDDSTSITYANLENDTLLDKNEKTNNDYSIKIEKLDNKINVTSSSTDENSILNKCNGTYDKKEYESKGWYGTYIFGSSLIYIDEYDTDSVIVNITNINKEHIIDKVTDNSLEFESNNNNVAIKLKIEKSDNGIMVTASSSDAQSEYNRISGNYLRKN